MKLYQLIWNYICLFHPDVDLNRCVFNKCIWIESGRLYDKGIDDANSADRISIALEIVVVCLK